MMYTPYIWTTCDFSGDAIEILDLFRDRSNLFFLDSSLSGGSRGRYSFIGFDPFDIVSCTNQDPFPILKRKYAKYFKGAKTRVSPLSSGIVGFFGYDLGLGLERISSRIDKDLPAPDCYFGFYDTIITIDHLFQKIYICSTGLSEKKGSARVKKANNNIKKLFSKIQNRVAPSKKKIIYPGGNGHDKEFKSRLKSNFTKAQYSKAIKKALEYIRQGDIYQVNLSQRFCFDSSSYVESFHPVELYKLLRALSPSSFGGYFDCDDFQIISSSPERFLQLKNGVVYTRPMKGTRPRGQDKEDDKKQESELLKSRKEQAELLMITDLERNDLGRVCEFGSVRVKEMRTIEEYNTVFQATSAIEGLLREDKDCFDLLRACFPGGSITGCPKIRAMEIIDELETKQRSIYTGAMGYISFTGEMDFNILIRTLMAFKEKIYFHVGGGIVSDSTPENEYNETLVKAKAINNCLEQFFCHAKK